MEYKNTPRQIYNSYKLPMTMDLEKWGLTQRILTNNSTTVKIIMRDSTVARVKLDVDAHHISLYKFDKLLIEFSDYKISDNSMKRVFDKKTFYFKDGKEVLSLEKLSVTFIKKLKPSTTFNKKKIITMDFETSDVFVKEGVIKKVPICLSMHDGVITKNYAR